MNLRASRLDDPEWIALRSRASTAPDSLVILREHQSSRWAAGNSVQVEEYATRFPELTDEDLLVLIVAEAQLRRGRGEQPNASDYQTRFPKLSADIALQFELLGELLPATTAAGGSAPDTDRTAPHIPAEAAELPEIPGYEIFGELGRGGMGVVYRARHEKLNREVALKMVLGSARAGGKELIRFLAEAEAAAAVRHPNVVQVYDYGESDGRPYMALEYLSGGTLAGLLESRIRRDPSALAALVAQIASGVGAVHEAGIVHRDLKPTNVLLDAAGFPRVTDFGLARKGPGAELTQTGAVVGTPVYMSPEQASGSSKFVGPQADVWALGVILQEALTGQRPFRAPVRDELLAQILTAEPEPLVGVPRDLSLICRKCLEKHPADRYPTAAELADDLGRFVRGEPISIRPAGPLERTYKWAKRKPTVAAVWALGFLAVLLASVGTTLWVAFSEARRERGHAEEARDELAVQKQLAEDARDEAEGFRRIAELANKKLARLEYGRAIQAAYQLWRETRIAEARAVLAGTKPELRGWEYYFVHGLCYPNSVSLEGHARGVRSASWNTDGTKVLTTCTDGTARIWDAATGGSLVELKVATHLSFSASWSPCGSKILTVDAAESTPRIWDATSGKVILELQGHSKSLWTAAWNRDGTRIVTAGFDQTARIWDAATGKTQRVLQGHAGPVRAAAFSPDGLRVVTGSFDKTARVWNAESGELVAKLEFGKGDITVVTFSPDGSKLLVVSKSAGSLIWGVAAGKPIAEINGVGGLSDSEIVLTTTASWNRDGSKVLISGQDKSARVCDAASGKLLLELNGGSGSVNSATFSPDGTRVVTAGSDNTARIWDSQTGERLAELTGHTLPITAASFRPDGLKLLTGSLDKTAKIRDLNTSSGVLELKGHTEPVLSATWNSQGSRVVTTSWDRTARIWDPNSGKSLLTLLGHTDPVASANFSPDGLRVVTASWDQSAHIWDAISGHPLRRVRTHNADIGTALSRNARCPLFAVWSPDGSRLLTISTDNGSPDGRFPVGSARIWNAASGKLLVDLRGVGPADCFAAWSPDGSKAVTTGLDGVARVWGGETGKLLTELRHTHAVNAAAFSPNGSRLMTAGRDGTTRIWDVASGKVLAEWSGHAASVNSACFNRAGSRVVTASSDNTARIWDVATGETVAELKGHTGSVVAAVFSPDDSRVLSVGEDGTIRLWDPESGVEVLALAGRSFAAFSVDGSRILTRGIDDKVAVIYARG